MSAQYETLKPFITDRINDLVRGRLLEGVKFFGTRSLNPGFSRREVKLALLLVRIANPKEYLTQQEVAILEAGTASQRKNGAKKAEIISIEHKKKATKPKRKKPDLS